MAKETKVQPVVTPKPAEAPKAVAPKQTLDELKAILKQSIETSNDQLFNETVTKIAKMKSEVAKAAADATKKEAEALAGIRQTVGKAIHDTIKGLRLDSKLAEVKAKGFTYKLDGIPDAQGVPVNYLTVDLLIPTIKTARGGTTGGGKSKAEYGLSLTEIFDRFATQAEKDLLPTLTAHNAAYFHKVAVKKAAIAAGLLQPVR